MCFHVSVQESKTESGLPDKILNKLCQQMGHVLGNSPVPAQRPRRLQRRQLHHGDPDPEPHLVRNLSPFPSLPSHHHLIHPIHPTQIPKHYLTQPLTIQPPNRAITYGDRSSAAGKVYRDVVSLGSSPQAKISFPYQTVETATRISPSFTSDPHCSGILGMGMSHGSAVRPHKALTFFDNIRDRLARPVFTADLRRQAPGRYGFGFVDRGAYVGEMGFADVSPPDSVWWRFDAGGFQVGDGNGTTLGQEPGLGQKREERWSTIADTGTSLLLAPLNVVREYYRHVRGAAYDREWAGWLFPCDAAMPDWSFFLSGSGNGTANGTAGYKGTVPGRYMVYSRANGTHCYGGMQSSDGIGFGVFGDVLLKAQYVVFDLGAKRVGFANKVLTS